MARVSSSTAFSVRGPNAPSGVAPIAVCSRATRVPLAPRSMNSNVTFWVVLPGSRSPLAIRVLRASPGQIVGLIWLCGMMSTAPGHLSRIRSTAVLMPSIIAGGIAPLPISAHIATWLLLLAVTPFAPEVLVRPRPAHTSPFWSSRMLYARSHQFLGLP